MRVSSLLFLVGTILALIGCDAQGGNDMAEPESQEENGLPKEVRVDVGEEPPSPTDVGIADQIEPDKRGGTIDVTLATFGETWNERATDLGRQDLNISDFEVGYGTGSSAFTHKAEDWLTVAGSIDYESNELHYAEVGWPEWDSAPEVDGETVSDSWTILIRASNPNLGSDEAIQVLKDLGLWNISGQELEKGVDTTTERDGFEYEASAGDLGGFLTVGPVSD